MPAHTPRNDNDGAPPIVEAACLILMDHSDGEARLLLGRRLPDQVFLPNKWVFPGGRVDDGDRAFAAALSGADGNAMPEDLPERFHLPFVRAAVREMYEEAGILVGGTPHARNVLPPAEPPFSGLAAHTVLSMLRPLARAITPPGFPRRFDTWFYLADWDRTAPPAGQPDGELLDLAWFTIPETRALDLPVITRYIVDDVASALDAGPASSGMLIPFYFQGVEGYQRTLIKASEQVASP